MFNTRGVAWHAVRRLLTTTLFGLLGLLVEQLGSAALLRVQDALAVLVSVPDDAPSIQDTTFPEIEHLPLRTSGRHILDSQGRQVRLRCVNWYGAHLETLVVGGLDRQPLGKLAFVIRALGFNCVRLPYSLELQLHPTTPNPMWLRANPALQNLTGLEILDKTVDALTAAKLLVVLNNHQGRAMWCCSEYDGEGLWYTTEYPEQVWLDALQSLAERYRQEPYVIGYDLRNEPRAAPLLDREGEQLGWRRPDWGSGRNDTDWAAAALRASQAVSLGNPQALLFVEGLAFATDLSGLRSSGQLHRKQELHGRVIYEAHDYCWYHPELLAAWGVYWLCIGWACRLVSETWRQRTLKDHTSSPAWQNRRLAASALLACWMLSLWLSSYSHFVAVISQRWGFLLEQSEAPVWLGEFGTNGPWLTACWWMEVGEVLWWRHLMRYLQEQEIDYAYWALNGDKAGEDETFGLLARDYSTLRHPWILQSLP